MRQRKPLVVANWKMNGNSDLVQQMSDALSMLKQPLPEILICPPVIFLTHFPKHQNYKLGAQNVSEQQSGAFTGEISADMLTAAGVTHAIIGHSERRSLYGELDGLISQKVKTAVDAGLTPILCIGETLQQREEEKTLEVLARQLDAVYAAQPYLLAHSVVSYEPIWAIGTGRTATPEQAQLVHQFIRQHLAQYDVDAADALRIIYGGSVTATNCQALFAEADIDGALIGGASLKVADFSAICEMAKDS
ncbi:triose-phosphate isomerase [Rheinheimera sediminis]|uniref:triose-phosphate isomerase n=1 Tax=Rheinheimera sp. YQF-1 TaxID=2499626 RepID=UPI000FDB9403|nr:triose-phosphate isomerase [Rheinheimera sp. YQF-1]RVT42794.1 triose-phosphate isomerase [Rheinheimera sp. YQF-1]